MSADEKDPKREKRERSDENEERERILEEWQSLAQELSKSLPTTPIGSWKYDDYEKQVLKLLLEAKALGLKLPLNAVPFWILPPWAQSETKRRSRKKRRRSDKKPKIRSSFRQQVVSYVIAHRDATAMDVCVWCDQQGIKVPKSWSGGAGNQRELRVIYRNDSVIKDRIDTYVSKVRCYIKEHL